MGTRGASVPEPSQEGGQRVVAHLFVSVGSSFLKLPLSVAVGLVLLRLFLLCGGRVTPEVAPARRTAYNNNIPGASGARLGRS